MKKKVKKMGQSSGTHILRTIGPISFKCGMYSRVYGGHKICEFDRNWHSGYRDIRGCKNGESVNNTLVCHTAFLAADTRTCVLIPLMQKALSANYLQFCSENSFRI